MPGPTKPRGSWPDNLPVEPSTANMICQTIKKWLDVFLFRFFQISQFKRSCLPNGPKVGSGGSLSPARRLARTVRLGSDCWLEELRRQCSGRVTRESSGARPQRGRVRRKCSVILAVSFVAATWRCLLERSAWRRCSVACRRDRLGLHHRIGRRGSSPVEGRS